MKSKLLKLSLVQLIISAAIFVINYFFYHFVTDEGITLVFHQEPGKPFVAMLIGFLAVLFLFGSTFTALFATIVYKNNDNNKTEK